MSVRKENRVTNVSSHYLSTLCSIHRSDDVPSSIGVFLPVLIWEVSWRVAELVVRSRFQYTAGHLKKASCSSSPFLDSLPLREPVLDSAPSTGGTIGSLRAWLRAW